MSSIVDVLTFWFGGPTLGHLPSKSQQQRWFAATPALDREIRCDFGRVTERALEGRLPHWRQTLRGELALVLLCDQFARNIYRGNEKAFAGDLLALEVTEDILRRGDTGRLGLFQQIFVGMPLEHSEKLPMQRRSVAYFSQLQRQYQGDPSVAPYLATHYRYALAHQAVIEQFGRYPHRNAALGRESTDEEKQWLAQGGGFK
ncbi:hypothetical protein Misp06_00471 [Microbulbifer sp. NBRC 101763]|uniref:DUF924 family protein n=1 Tax=Microbulbifer TaxID=48073 RepID=UPI000370B203|nr:DUF924 family protein [Microbulbifer variabilis]